jgi:hypothetical protein
MARPIDSKEVLMADARHPAPRRRLRPIHVVIMVVLVGVLGCFAFQWSHLAATAVGKGPPTDYGAPRTTRQEAEAYSSGQGREGANPSGDSYTTQNQSQPPPSERR